MLKAMIDPKAAKQAGFNLWRTVAVASVMLWVLVIFDAPISRVVTGEHPENHLQIELVDFQGGMFRQSITPTQGIPKQGEWSASIFDGYAFVCGGGGNGTYTRRTEPAVFSPNDWTGDDCFDEPNPLIPGKEYRATASWEYVVTVTEENLNEETGEVMEVTRDETHEISTDFTFTYEEPKE